MLNIQKLFQSCNSMDEFRLELSKIGVDVRDYPDLELFLLDYNQIECIKDHPVVIECRGLIMSYKGDIVRKGYDRFFNLGEVGVSEFDFENSITFEKADGSLCFIYFCPQTDKWEIGTRGTAFAEGNNDWYGTFRGFFLNAMGRTEEEFQSDCAYLDKDRTHLFEGVGPDNRIVRPYKTNHLVELGQVNNITGEESLPDNSQPSFYELTLGWNVKHLEQYSFNTKEECMIALEALTGLKEGYVVYNKLTGKRVKIKNAVYLAAHRLRGNGLTVNAICELVVINEVSEYLSVFPEDAHRFDRAIEMFGWMTTKLESDYNKFKHIEDQKEFALQVKDLELSGVIFKARKTGNDVIHEFNSFPVNKRADWLKERL